LTVKLNNDQTRLIFELSKFWKDDSRQYFVLSGQAGVGKTTSLRFFIDYLKKTNPGIKICMTAPTNKAVSVLNDIINDPDITFKTIYSILGLRMQANGEVKELTDTGEDRITDFDLVGIDEGSMLNTVVLDYIKKKLALSETKVLMIGDKEQLNPVGEKTSPIWKTFPIGYELTEVMRHQNEILDFVQSIRANKNPVFESTGPKVKIAEEDDFINEILRHSKDGLFHSGKSKAIAWRNVTVDYLNSLIRDNNDLTKSPDRFVIGDRVVTRAPIMGSGDRMLAATDEEAEVIGVEIIRHMRYPMLKAWKVSMRMDHSNAKVDANVIHEDSAKEFQRMLDEFKAKKRWDLFWKLNDAFHLVSYGYAFTAHRSQGSTFRNVFLDAGDVMLNRDLEERTKCLYVGSSRASNQLWIFP
jgi:exodeoxyribonuclease-5